MALRTVRLVAGREGTPVIYTIRAYWPNCTMDPYVKRVAHLAEAVDEVIRLAQTGKHTTISCVVDALEVLRMWGQLEGLQ